MPEEYGEERPGWYAIHTKPMEEGRVESNLMAWGVETFAPKVRVRRDNEFTGKPVYYTRPMFPRYTFAKFKLSGYLRKITFTRGVQKIVSFGGLPAMIDDEIIELIRERINEEGFVKLDDFRPGDRVVIKGGAFKNLVGIFDSTLKDHERVSILLTAVSFQNRVVIKRDLLAKVSSTAS
jgi:transcriptional antiterminator RfaH